jgi:hypothetical protein
MVTKNNSDNNNKNNNYIYKSKIIRLALTFLATGKIVNWTVPVTGLYSITANGAQGGSGNLVFGCLGASIKGLFSLYGGQTLSILVGQQPSSTTWPGGGGGRVASFLVVFIAVIIFYDFLLITSTKINLYLPYYVIFKCYLFN